MDAETPETPETATEQAEVIARHKELRDPEWDRLHRLGKHFTVCRSRADDSTGIASITLVAVGDAAEMVSAFLDASVPGADGSPPPLPERNPEMRSS